MEENSIEFVDYNIVCRVCLSEGIVNIYETTFKFDGQEIEVSTAFENFSTLKPNCANNDESKTLLCEQCVNNLLSAYEFLQKVHKSDRRFTELQPYIIQPNSDNDAMEDPQTMNTTDDNIEVIVIKDQDQFDEELKKNDNENEKTKKIRIIDDIHLYHQDIKTNNLDVEFLEELELQSSIKSPKKTFIDRSKRKSDYLLDEDESDVKSPFVVLAKYNVIDYQHESVQPSESDWTGKTIKTIEMVAVRIDVAEAHIPIAIPSAEDDVLMYACKYCPKAFASPYHLVTHLKKIHVCQFCLEGFSKLKSLQEHIKTAHIRFDCVLCSRDFISNKNLRSHIKRAHDINLPAFVSLLSVKLDS